MTATLSRERLKRIHALCGVFPLGVFVVLHLAGNATALWGRGRFQAHLSWVDGLPWRGFVEVVGLLVPLLVHVALGVRLMFDPDPASSPPGWGRALQRATGLLALVFIAVHLGHYRWPRVMGELSLGELYDRLSMDLQGMGRFAFYLAGTSAVVFHLSQGVVRFILPAERAVAPAARRRVIAVCGTFGFVLWLLALQILGHYYAGGSFP